MKLVEESKGIYPAGIEIIGVNSPEADAEVIAELILSKLQDLRTFR